jgi:hypothetical protein
MKRWWTGLILCMTLSLSSCGILSDSIDKGLTGGRELIAHTTEEFGKLKTETLQEVRQTIEEVTPKVIESFLNADAIAFLIVTVSLLGGLVVLTALWLILGAARTLYKRWQHPPNCSARHLDKQS